MCVGLSAKVIKITDGTALVDASGAKRNISVELLEEMKIWSREITLWFMPELPSPRSPMRTFPKRNGSWRRWDERR